MHELLEVIAYLFDVLLMPFTNGGDPKNKTIKIIGLVIAGIGVLCLLGLFAWAYLAPVKSS